MLRLREQLYCQSKLVLISHKRPFGTQSVKLPFYMNATIHTNKTESISTCNLHTVWCVLTHVTVLSTKVLTPPFGMRPYDSGPKRALCSDPYHYQALTLENKCTWMCCTNYHLAHTPEENSYLPSLSAPEILSAARSRSSDILSKKSGVLILPSEKFRTIVVNSS